MNKLQEDFIEKYKELEELVKEEYALDDKSHPIHFLMNQDEFSFLKKEIDYCRQVRNFLQHENKINGSFAVTPSIEMVKLLDYVIEEVKYPLQAKDIMTKEEKVFYKSKKDIVIKSIIEMENKYTHIPIVEDGKVTGVFSSSSLFGYMKDNKKFSLEVDLTFEMLENYLLYNKSERYLYISQNMRINRIKDLFDDYYKKAKRIGMMIVTESGKKEEKFLGIITPYDLLKEIK